MADRRKQIPQSTTPSNRFPTCWNVEKLRSFLMHLNRNYKYLFFHYLWNVFFEVRPSPPVNRIFFYVIFHYKCISVTHLSLDKMLLLPTDRRLGKSFGIRTFVGFSQRVRHKIQICICFYFCSHLKASPCFFPSGCSHVLTLPNLGFMHIGIFLVLHPTTIQIIKRLVSQSIS